MRAPWRVLAAPALALLLSVTGCSDGTSRFADEVRALEDAVEAGDRDAAIQAFQSLQADVRAAHDEGDVDGDDLNALRALLYESRLLLDAVLPPPSTEPPPPPSTAPPPPQPADGESSPEKESEDEKEDDQEKDDKDDEDEGGHPGRGRGRD